MANKKDKETKSAHEKIQESRKAIVDEVVKLLESGKKLDWSMGWNGTNLNPHNPVSGARYQGANRLRLAFAAIINEYQDPRWCTFAQARAQDWQIKKGAKGVLCESFIFEREVKDLDENGKEKRDENGNIVYKKEKLEKPIRTTFTVFNASQIHGIPQLEMPESPSTDFQLGVAKVFIDSSDCPISYAAQKRAFYAPGLDRIFVPPKEFFKDEESFFATVTHEMGHSTGHKSRLDRNMKGSYGSKSYAKEELVAELCSMFTQSNLNIELKGEHFENHAAYLQSWISILKDDPNELFIAAEKASKAADYLYERYMEYNNERLKSHGIDIEAEKAKENESSAMQIDLVDEKTNDLVKDGALANSDKDAITPKDLGVPVDEYNSAENTQTERKNSQTELKFVVGENNNQRAVNRAAQAYKKINERINQQELLKANGLGDPIFAYSGIVNDDPRESKILNDTMLMRAYKHNLWGSFDAFERLGGKIKDGEEPLYEVDDLGDDGQGVYNIEQFEGVDLNLSAEPSNPQIQAYIQEHAEELKTIHPNGLPITPFNHMVAAIDSPNFNDLQQVLQEKGYKHNIWIHAEDLERLGGKIKDGEEFAHYDPYFNHYYYNIDQTEGIDLNLSEASTHPQVQAYLKEKALGEPILANAGIPESDESIVKKLNEVMQERGYKHNLWLFSQEHKYLGGKIRDGEEPLEDIFEYNSVYNIEQTEGIDLNLSSEPTNAQIQAYMKEHADELKNIHPNGLPITHWNAMACTVDSREFNEFQRVLQKRGYKHNIWLKPKDVELLGGKIKDGEQRNKVNAYYNIEQTEGVDLNVTHCRNNPQVQAYLKEHPVEMNPNLPINASDGLLLELKKPYNRELYVKAMEEHGYKHNIWATKGEIESLGGKIKSGELPSLETENRRYYNIEQTEGVDLNNPELTSSPYIQAYLKEKALENLGTPIYAYTGLAEFDAPTIKKLNEVMQERGYKHNLWLMKDDGPYLGGKIKDGEKPITDRLDVDVYNIEQFEGVDLNLSDNPYHPQIQAYIQEYAEELKNIHPNGLPITHWNFMACKTDLPYFNKLQQVFQEKGYKHNIWATKDDVDHLGGKIKDGEHPLVKTYYNIEQTECVDLNLSYSRNNPQTQAYIKEHPVEMNPNLPILAGSGRLLEYRDPDVRALQPHVKAMEKHGYKHNLWLDQLDAITLGGKIKDGEKPAISTTDDEYSYYNIDQTEGVDLNQPWLKTSPYIQAYLKEKSLENLGVPIYADTGIAEVEATPVKQFNEAMQERGYKHNLWLLQSDAFDLGGKIKDGQEHFVTIQDGPFEYSYYNIEQFEGVDLSLTAGRNNPQVQAYIKEHPVEMNPNLPIDASDGTLLEYTDLSDLALQPHVKAVEEHGYNHNLWIHTKDLERLGGKVKDGQEPSLSILRYGPIEHFYYNIEQTVGIDLNKPELTSSPYIQAYLKEKALGEPIFAYSGLVEDEKTIAKKFNEAMQERGYKHNLWGGLYCFERLGGKLKDGEEPIRDPYDESDPNKSLYNIEQFEGVDLNLSNDSSHPQIQAYIKEHADELKNIHPNGLPITTINSLVFDTDSSNFKNLMQVFQEKGYKHNIWVNKSDVKCLGGKIKDGEELSVKIKDYSFYNIEQTEGVDLNLTFSRNNPQVQAYMKEHPVEMDTNIPIKAYSGTLLEFDSNKRRELCVKAMEDHGYKNNIWLTADHTEYLGGKIKDGQEPSVTIKEGPFEYSYYNIEQTEGVDLNQPRLKTSPYIQAYLKEKALEALGEPFFAYSGLVEDEKTIAKKVNEAMQEHGYKHNIWGRLDEFEELGGKLKDDQEPIMRLDFKYAPNQAVYNIEQFEGVDLNLSVEPTNPQIQAYIQEHADELKNIHPNGLPIDISFNTVLFNTDSSDFKNLMQVFQEKGYKHNIWLDKNDVELHGGKIKDGEQPLVAKSLYGPEGLVPKSYYNIEQTEGVDLTLTVARNNAHVQAYMKEHPVEINPKLPIDAYNGTLMEEREPNRGEFYVKAMEEHGYKHNLWVTKNQAAQLGGKIKDGEHPHVKIYYNIEQTEGVDLNKPELTTSPYIQAYLKEKALEALGDPILPYSGIVIHKDSKILKEDMLDKGYKHNLWVGEYESEYLGGKIKDGEQPSVTIKDGQFEYSYYNIEQTEGIDLNLSSIEVHTNPQIQAYIKEHAEELKTIHPNGLPITTINTVVFDTDSSNFKNLMQVFQEKGYKHNIWVEKYTVEVHGGKIKDGEQPLVDRTFYNIEQTEGFDLTLTLGRNNPQIQAYIKEYPVEINPKLPIDASDGTLLEYRDPNRREFYVKAMEEHGYKNNLWIHTKDLERLGGKVKDGQEPTVTVKNFFDEQSYFNIEQTEGIDLNKPELTSSPYIQAYLKEKALENLGDPIYPYSGVVNNDPKESKILKEVMQEYGYKHNLWGSLESFYSLGGKLKDDEWPFALGDDSQGVYNIEQFEGVDLNLSADPTNPQIQAYIQEHADELKTIHPNGLPIDAVSGFKIDAHLRDIENVMTERGFKHNIWLNSRIFSDFVGGKIKDGERPCVVVDGYSYYNIGQSEGCDLNFASGRIHPQIQAYIKENPINVDPNIPIGACTGSIFIHNTPNVLNKAMQKHGYKHNLWVCVGGVHRENEVEDLGGKLKDGEKPAYTNYVLGEIYNIEQTEGCDLKKYWAETWSVSHPYIDAYLDAQKQQDHSRSANEILSTQTPDHPVADRGVPSANQEGVTLNSNSFAQPKQKVGDATMAQENKGNQVPINGLSGRQYTKGNFTTLEKAYHVKGHSNNIWVTENQAAQLGGKVKEGEQGVTIKVPHFEKGKGFTCTNAIVYNLDQTIGCNLNLSKNPNHPQIQAYIQSHQQTLTQTQQQPQQANPVLSDELTQSQGNISPASIKAVQQQSNQFVTDAVKNRADQMKTKEAPEQDAGMSYLDEQGTKKAPPRAKPRSKEPRNKDPER